LEVIIHEKYQIPESSKVPLQYILILKSNIFKGLSSMEKLKNGQGQILLKATGGEN
jgi:hypothetical protein